MQGRPPLFLAHPQRDSLWGTEQVGQYRDPIALRVFKQQRRAAGAQRAVGDLGHLQIGIYLLANAFEQTPLLQQGDEITKILIFHMVIQHLSLNRL